MLLSAVRFVLQLENFAVCELACGQLLQEDVAENVLPDKSHRCKIMQAGRDLPPPNTTAHRHQEQHALPCIVSTG